ncbi:hypothetical protein KY330_05595 [Candidatus Woesearchaeota archaeon]|nr:hypothetical protein [Candidatus Woesearchaeota archaeon]
MEPVKVVVVSCSYNIQQQKYEKILDNIVEKAVKDIKYVTSNGALSQAKKLGVRPCISLPLYRYIVEGIDYIKFRLPIYTDKKDPKKNVRVGQVPIINALNSSAELIIVSGNENTKKEIVEPIKKALDVPDKRIIMAKEGTESLRETIENVLEVLPEKYKRFMFLPGDLTSFTDIDSVLNDPGLADYEVLMQVNTKELMFPTKEFLEKRFHSEEFYRYFSQTFPDGISEFILRNYRFVGEIPYEDDKFIFNAKEPNVWILHRDMDPALFEIYRSRKDGGADIAVFLDLILNRTDRLTSVMKKFNNAYNANNELYDYVFEESYVLPYNHFLLASMLLNSDTLGDIVGSDSFKRFANWEWWGDRVQKFLLMLNKNPESLKPFADKPELYINYLCAALDRDYRQKLRDFWKSRPIPYDFAQDAVQDVFGIPTLMECKHFDVTRMEDLDAPHDLQSLAGKVHLSPYFNQIKKVADFTPECSDFIEFANKDHKIKVDMLRDAPDFDKVKEYIPEQIYSDGSVVSVQPHPAEIKWFSCYNKMVEDHKEKYK